MWSRASSRPWRARVIRHGSYGTCHSGVAALVVEIIFVLMVVLASSWTGNAFAPWARTLGTACDSRPELVVANTATVWK